jgi:hypothetical protein
MEETKLASEILKELKINCKRNFVLFIITLVLLFATNAIWLYVWCLPVEETTSTTTTTVDQDTGGDGTNNYIGEEGDIYNGTTASDKNEDN